jgi:hypothetical protein
MKESPILYTTENVKAILEGRKTQTRKVIKPQPYMTVDMGKEHLAWIISGFRTAEEISRYCPYGQAVDHLWVRETWMAEKQYDHLKPSDIPQGSMIWFKTDNLTTHIYVGKNRPSIFMPRWVSRITLEITEVRVERVQQISQEDAVEEGVIFMGGIADNYEDAPWCASLKDQEPYKYPSAAYGRLWDSINGKKYPWSTNPFVWCISFKVVEK